MSLKKKIEKELKEFNEDICVDCTEFNKTYYIYLWNDKNKLNGFNFYYNNDYKFNENISSLKMLCIIFFKLKSYKCYLYKEIRYKTIEQYEECKKICSFVNSFRRCE